MVYKQTRIVTLFDCFVFLIVYYMGLHLRLLCFLKKGVTGLI